MAGSKSAGAPPSLAGNTGASPTNRPWSSPRLPRCGTPQIGFHQELAMKHGIFSVAALGLGAAALLVSLLTRGGGEAAAQGAAARLSSKLADAEVRLGAIDARLDLLAEQVARASSQSRPAITPRPFAAESAEPGPLADRLARLEERVAGLTDAARPAAPRPQSAPTPDPVDVQRTIDLMTQIARNASASEKDRLEALRKLRGARLPDGTDARLGVVEEMVRLAESSQNENVRADVWRQLSHVTDRSMLSPLLAALQNDASARVREEAAETLADFLPDESVRRALQHAADNDQNPKVRSQAFDSLGARPR
jgi:hypothetical protein